MNFFGATLLIFFLLGQLAFDNKKEKSFYKWETPAIPAQMDFAGEAVPLNRWEVKERLDREIVLNFYNQANILLLLKLSNRYFPLISERLKANGVPDDFKYLCVAESNLQGAALSGSKAVSFWQFLNGTAPGYGLEVNSQVDERYNIEKATDAACIYFKQAYRKFGSWTAAAASYNCGQTGYNNRAIRQRTKNYYDLILPEETNRYMFRILAFKHLLQNAEELGFTLNDEEKYQTIPSRTVHIDKPIPDLVQFAIDNGTSYKMLRVMNPWIRGSSLTASEKKPYDIQLPEQ
jgi:hypothetical protein